MWRAERRPERSEKEVLFLREESSRGWVWIDEASSPLLELNHKKSLFVWFGLRPVGIKFSRGEKNSPKKRPKSSSPVFVHNEKRNRGIKNLADLKPLCLSFSLTEDSSLFFLSLCPCLGLCCTVGGQAGGGEGALLGRLAQLYLLLDDPSRVVDERVDQTGHCGSRADRKWSGTEEVRFYLFV